MTWMRPLLSRIDECRQLPDGVTDKTKIAARILVELNPDGSLKSTSLVDVTPHPKAKGFVESVIAALKRCQPYAFLPADECKGGWDKLDMNFAGDPAVANELKSLAMSRFNAEKLPKALEQRRRARKTNDDRQ